MRTKGLQMSDKWIEKNLENMFDEIQALDIKINSNKMLTGVSKDGNVIEIFELTNNAKTINTTKL